MRAVRYTRYNKILYAGGGVLRSIFLIDLL